MRRVASYVLIVTLMTAVSTGGEEGVPKGWMHDYSQAEARAKALNTPLVVHFFADWCGPCRTMETEVLGSAEVRAAIGNGIVGVKVNSDTNRDLVARFGVTSLPTDVIVSPTGKVLSKSVGSPGRAGYLARLSQFRTPEASQPRPAADVQIAAANSQMPVTPVASANIVNLEIADALVSGAASPDSVAIDSVAVVSNSAESDEPSLSGNSVSNTDPAEKPAMTQKSSRAMTRTLRREADLRIGLSGYSPVALVEGEKWKTGESQFKHEFQGVCYLLSSAEELARFKASPEKFAPVLHGCDPVSLLNENIVQTGHIELGVTYHSRVYFFATQKSRDEFLSNPEKFATTQNLAFFNAETSGET
ncbi:MAG TPA: thioredoxin domain-containing protein [Planctomycetaceae bacterium]|nr:thioredoxin domain-containing protein [Planctomycetaceae bacterium]